jgi:drug/metabolite transporter (DMT)-like permease
MKMLGPVPHAPVLVNAQVVIVPLLALVIDREPVHRRYLFCLPWLILGVMLTPVGALALSAVVLGERPSALQLVGSVMMLASAYASTSGLKWCTPVPR